ncbi:hypothetical protein NEMBOFW57_010725 [Staphylotrichum longicolle]|uniref:Stress-response A/B barrel domain-containing protein n=1 Tax=Staphylotrichum longicolle TaxID=669026 RepID=A0AAD4EN89_9PEZI|nr:hypothetical protein NEMBOFW57_010725 [Staphylotrichum longicolle]
MPVYHIALFKLKEDADPKRIQKWQRLAKGMVGQVPAMAKGFDMGVVVLLDYVESLATFFTHPSHDE